MKKGVEAAKEQAWEALAGLDPADVCARAAVTYDVGRCVYICPSMGQDVVVDPATRTVVCDTPAGDILLGRLGYFSQVSILSYLINAKNTPFSGKLVAPISLPSGQLYFRGSHVLPTDQLIARYGDAPEPFLARGRELGGQPLSYGDAAIRLLPLPRLPVVVVLWRGDDEFPARVSVLLDDTSEDQAPPDIVWSTAMLSVLALVM